MCGVTIDEKNVFLLDSIGVKDSKLLTAKQRKELFTKIIEIVDSYEIIIVPVDVIDQAVLSPNTNLNWLEGDTSAKIINKLKPNKAILDCPSNNTKAYSDYMKRKIDGNVELIVEHKADLKYTVVGAASILAKETRDAQIEKIKQDIGVNLGSGYPSDEVTQKFTKENWDKYPEIFRKSWSTYKKFSESKKQKQLGEF